MSAVNSISASQFGSTPTLAPTSRPDAPHGLQGVHADVSAPLPGMGSTMTSQGRVTAWRTNSSGSPMPLSGKTNGSTMRFDS